MPEHRRRVTMPASRRQSASGEAADLRRQLATFKQLSAPGSRRAQAVDGQEAELVEMGRRRRFNQRTAAMAGAVGTAGGGGQISFATGRPRDPFFYWRQNNLFYDFDDNTQLERVRKFCHLLYASHSLIGSCVDIYTEYPLLGMELRCKDDKVIDFYDDLFMSPERLNYPEFLGEMGKSYWLLGESWPFGSFNEKLGVWEDEELLNPDDIEVERSPFQREPRYLMRLPSTLREILQSRAPAYEYNKLIQAYPELVRYQNENELMPVSGILLRQLKFKGLLFNKRGIPLLNRALRPIIQEEMLNSAMDAIADRLYVPLLIAKLGASATDLGTDVPWIPTDDDMAAFEETADAALAADFRLLTTNFATTLESVFGREQMPDLTADFERIEDKILQTFGLSKTMLTGASSGQTYAADALNRDLISQMLTRYQKMLSNHYRERALVVAEAQGHFDYDIRGGKRYVKMEEVLEVDEESGEERIVEQPKLLIPDLHFKCTTPETPVLTPAGYARADSLRVGDDVVAWDEEHDELLTSQVEDSRSNGERPVLRVKTRRGRVLDTTENHPYWTNRGWVLAEDLKLSDEVRVATGYDPSPTSTVTTDQAYFFGVMVGDGGLTGHAPVVTSADESLIEWLDTFAADFGCRLVRTGDAYDYRFSQGAGVKTRNRVKDLLKEHDLWGHGSRAKRIPASVWSGGRDAWVAFLSGYLDTDGTVNPNRLVSWASVNHDLMSETQTLLGLLGVKSSLVTIDHQGVVSHRVNVTSRRDLLMLADLLSPKLVRKTAIWTRGSQYHANREITDEQVAQAKRLFAGGMRGDLVAIALGLSRSTAYRAIRGEYDGQNACDTSVEWDPIISIERLGDRETWSLTVSGTHTHVTAGLITHNTLNLKDEEAERGFYEQLRAAGVPISMKTRLINVPIDLPEEMEITQEEQIQLAVAEQETRKAIFLALRQKGLPVPPDLLADFGPQVNNLPQPADMASRVPMLGLDPLVDNPNLAPTEEDLAIPTEGTEQPGVGAEPVEPVAMMGADGSVTPLDPTGGVGQRPEESDEMREDMPKAAMISEATLWRRARRMRDVVDEQLGTIQAVIEYQQQLATTAKDEDGNPLIPVQPELTGPRHVGLRRHLGIKRGDEWEG